MKLTNAEIETINEMAQQLADDGSYWLNTHGEIEYDGARGYQPEVELMIAMAEERGITEGSPNFEELNEEFCDLFYKALYNKLEEILEEE